jgi:type II secretion system protein N
MRRAAFVALAIGVFIVAFTAGLAAQFPSAAVTRAIEGGIASTTALSVALGPVRLTATGLRSDRLTIRNAGAVDEAPWLTLTELRVPLHPSLWRGAPLIARFGSGGQVRGFLAWDGSILAVEQLTARLEDLPPAAGLAGIGIKGGLSLSGQANPGRARRTSPTELPNGEFRGRLEAVEISGAALAGSKLPPARLDEVEFLVRTGHTVQIERFQVRGDLQGTVQGSITPNPGRIQDSRLSLQVTASVRPGWLQDAGALRPILEGFFPGGRIEGAVTGTIAMPNWNPARGLR